MSGNDIVLKENMGIRFLTSLKLDSLGFIRHFFSTRIGGVSASAYNSLNLGVYTEDDEQSVSRNFELMFKAADMKSKKIVYLNQVHGDRLIVVDYNNMDNVVGEKSDAVITCEKGISIGIFTADCVPVLIVDTSNKAIGAAHAGWKGTQLGIAAKVASYMVDKMNSDPNSIVAAIGPSIGPCCFEVGKDVAEKFTCTMKANGRYYVDLWNENKKQLMELGIPDKNISISGFCTMCSGDLFYSYRRESGKTGRMGAFIEII